MKKKQVYFYKCASHQKTVFWQLKKKKKKSLDCELSSPVGINQLL